MMVRKPPAQLSERRLMQPSKCFGGGHHQWLTM
jgi:hypothetical protein